MSIAPVPDEKHPGLQHASNDAYLAQVSHELRTPLTSVVGALGLLSAGHAGELPEMAQELVDIAYRNSQRLSRLIDDVLDIAKLESERMPLNIMPCDLQGLLQEAIGNYQGLAKQLDVRLSPVDWPSEPTSVWINADPDRFAQIIGNLLSNAMKFSPTKGLVQTQVRVSHAHASVHVIDQGPGIAPDHIESVFDKYVQVKDRQPSDPAMAKTGGTGLGLYIARHLAQRMDARIEVQSQLGCGAEFILHWPLVRSGAGHGGA
jgi:signal transduction histidine kinase